MCFGSEEHLRARGVKNAYTGTNEKPRVILFLLASHLGKSALSFCNRPASGDFSKPVDMQIQHSVQHSSCRTLRQGLWKGSNKFSEKNEWHCCYALLCLLKEEEPNGTGQLRR